MSFRGDGRFLAVSNGKSDRGGPTITLVRSLNLDTLLALTNETAIALVLAAVRCGIGYGARSRELQLV